MTNISATANNPIDTRQTRVQAELIAVLYGRARGIIYANLAVGLLSAMLVLRKAPPGWLIFWVAFLLLLTTARLMLVAAYRRTAPQPDAALWWGKAFAVSSAASGIFWGCAAIAVYGFLPADALLSVFATMIFAGYAASSVQALAPYLPACYAFLAPLLLCVMSGFMVRANELQFTLAAITGVYLTLNIVMARNSHRSQAESIALRFENMHLIEELKLKKGEAEAANVAKSKFLAAASHDLRQPLHALMLFVSALNEHIRYPEVRKIVDNINMSVHALEQLFNSLLDISRLDAGVIRPQISDFHLQDLFERLRCDYEVEAGEKHLGFDCPASALVVRSEPQLLERILRNYLSNAIRYTSRGEVSLRAIAADGTVRIEVTDSGQGIPHDKHEEIFHEFHQLDNPERDRTKGLGLGLAIVDRLSRLLQHPIAMESEPGCGSVFSVLVPAGDPAAAKLSGAKSRVPAIADLSGMLVLIVDDECSIREGMDALLAQWGCERLLANSEEEAVACLRRCGRTPDVVIADYRLREDRTGAQTIERIRLECGTLIPALIVTGDTAPDRLREAAASGCRILHKPILPAQLRAFLNQARLQAAIK